MGRALRRIPSWAWLAAIVAVSTSFRAVLARDMVAPFILVDEIIWSEIARGIADAGEPLIRGEPDPGYSIVYPLLISPVYALFENLVDAYAGVKTLNSFVMSLAAVPAFFLARRVVRDGLALLAAVMTVAVPSMAYTGTVMTENPFYPLFLLVALVLVVALERPSPLVVVGLYALVGVAFATRVQAVALVPAILLAPLVLAVFQRRGFTATISRFRWVYGIAAGAVVAVLAIQLAFGSLLGAYSPVGEQSYDLAEVLRYLWWHVAELALYVLVIPLAATIVLVATARSLDARVQPFLAATVGLTVCVVPVVAAFAAEFSDRIQERNMFYVAPLLCIALLAWIERGAPRPRLLASVAAVISAVLVTAIPLDRFITTSALTDTLMLLPFWSLQDRIGAEWIEVAAAGLAVAPRRPVPLRAEALRAGSPPGRPRSLDPRDPADLVRQARFRARIDRSAVPGDSHRRSRLGRPGAAAGRRRRFRLVGTYRSPDREPERVLQPRRRSRLLRHRTDAWWAARAGDPHRPARPAPSRSRTAARFVTPTSSPTRPSSPPAMRSRPTRAGASRSGAWTLRSSRPRASTVCTRGTRGPAPRSRTPGDDARRGGCPWISPATRTSSSSRRPSLPARTDGSSAG